MKTLIKRHLIGVFALVLTVATMSFKMVSKSNQQVYWFLVEDGTVTNTQMDESQTCAGEGPACAIAFSRDTEIPSNLGDAESDPDWEGTAYGTLHSSK